MGCTFRFNYCIGDNRLWTWGKNTTTNAYEPLSAYYGSVNTGICSATMSVNCKTSTSSWNTTYSGGRSNWKCPYSATKQFMTFKYCGNLIIQSDTKRFPVPYDAVYCYGCEDIEFINAQDAWSMATTKAQETSSVNYVTWNAARPFFSKVVYVRQNSPRQRLDSTNPTNYPCFYIDDYTPFVVETAPTTDDAEGLYIVNGEDEHNMENTSSFAYKYKFYPLYKVYIDNSTTKVEFIGYTTKL